MAVTLSYSNITIRGVTYKQGSSFKCYASYSGNGGSEGNGGSATALTKGETYYVYAKATGDNVQYPYAVSTTSGGSPMGWYKENVFPYATYTINYYANGGAGAPGSQTKTHGTNLTLSSTKPTRTGYTFQGWGISANDTSVDYAAGATYSANASISLYAIWKANTYTITFNANGGTGGPSSITKTHGVNVALPTSIPTRTNYEFLGWHTMSNATTPSYKAGDVYKGNSSTTLYAIWGVEYYPPTITDLKVIRCDANGNPDDFGVYVKVTFSWSCNQSLGVNNVSEIRVVYIKSGTSAGPSTRVAASGISGTTTAVIGGDLSIETPYEIRVYVTDTKQAIDGGTTSKYATLPSAKYVIDFLSGGNGVAIGGAATLSDTFEVNFATKFTGGIVPVDIPHNRDLNDYTTPGFYRCSLTVDAKTIDNVPEEQAFILEVTQGVGTKQIFTTYQRTDFNSYIRQKYNTTWGAWVRIPYEGSVPMLKNKTALSSGSNLDNIVTPGTYACNDAIASSLSNSPSTYGFTMDVSYSYGTTDYITQRVFVPYYETEYSRRCTVSNRSWSAWKSDFAHDTGWITLNTVIKYRRVGKTVFVLGESSNSVSLTSGSYTKVGTLPAGFRPSLSMPFTWNALGGDVWTQTSYITSGGSIEMYHKEGAAESYWRFSVAFPVDTSV